MRRRPTSSLVALLVFLGSSALLALVVWPQGFGAARLAPFVWTTALRMPLLIGLAVSAVVLLVVAWRRRGRRVVLLPIAAALVLAACASGAVLSSRGSAAVAGETLDAVSVRVLSWNTEHAVAGASVIADAIVEAEAGIVMLPETDAVATAGIAAELESRGYRVAHDTVEQVGFPGSVPTSVMFLDTYADAGYERVTETGSSPGQPSGLWAADDDELPVVGAVHTVPPMPWAVPLWSAGLDWVASACVDQRAIVAGDLNATVDHMAGLGVDGADIGRCRDAASVESAAARGTWPSDAPEWLASPIDHVLVGSAWRVVSFDVGEVTTDPGSDHRPVIMELSPAA